MLPGFFPRKKVTDDRRGEPFVRDHAVLDLMTKINEFLAHQILSSLVLEIGQRNLPITKYLYYLVAKIPPTTLVITNLPSRSNQRVATSEIFPIKVSYSSLPLNMEVHNLRSSL